MIFSPIKRLFTIIRLSGRYRLDEYIDPKLCPRALKVLFYLNPWRLFPITTDCRAIRLRKMFEELGPIFVKFGQVLSTRRDLLPDDISDELALLQDAVPPFPGQIAAQIIEQQLGASPKTLFCTFTDEAFASASIAQVHGATLADGKEVIVKVLRPNMRKIISKDIKLMYLLAALLTRFWSEGPRLRANEIVKEFENTIDDELNLRIEAANASQLRRNFADSDIIYVPEIYWDYIAEKVLVMERIYGTPISDVDTLKRHNVNLKKLSERGVEIFFTQVFRDCFFHADMHPGNIFVDIRDPENPKYCAVDFGIMGTLNENDQRYLAENFLAFFNRDYRRVAKLHIESGWVPSDTRVDQFESAIRSVSEPIFELPLSQISFARVLVQLFQTASRFNMPIQPQLMLLQKTFINIEGLGRELYPELDLWSTAKPYLERWLKDQVGLRSFAKNVRELAPYWLEKTPELPNLIHRSLLRLSQSPMWIDPDKHTQKTHRRSGTKWLAVAAIILGGGALFGLVAEENLHAPMSLVIPTALLTVLGIAALGLAATSD